MLNIKSKAIKLFAGLMVALFVLSAASFASADTITLPSTGVKKTSSMVVIKNLQSFLNWNLGASITPLVVDGKWGAKTNAAIRAYQTANGLKSDGMFGRLSAAKAAALMSSGGSMSTIPGCTSTVGFSPTTGQSCSSGVYTPPVTGLVPGCTSTSGFSQTTGASCSTGTITQSGPITAMLATTNPASGTIVAGQATADLLHVTFTGNGTVNSVTLSRSGVSDQNTLSNVYLYDGVTRLTDGYSFNTNGTITINGLNLAVNGSRTISVKADVLSTTTSYNVIVTLTSFSSGTSVNTVNIKGNDMFVAGGGSLATIAKDSTGAAIGATGGNTVATASVNAGTTSYTVWRQAVQVNTRALQLKAANFRITGSAPSDALSNAGFYVDGVKVGGNATMTMTNSSNYLSFDMSAAPVSLSTGSHSLEVRADIVKGSSYSFTVSLQQASDIMVTDPQIGVNLAMCGVLACTGSFTASTSGTITIGTGSYTVVVDPTFSTYTTTTAGSSNVVIAKFKVRGYGEDVKVTSLPILPILTIPSTTYSSGTVTTGSQSVTVAATTGFAVGNVITVAGATIGIGTVTSITSSTVMVVNFTTGGVTPAGVVTLSPATGLGLQNVTLYFNGSQVGTQQGWTAGALTFTLGSQLIIPAGVDSTLEVRADLRTSSAGTNYNGGVVSANVQAATAEGVNSKATITGATATGTLLSLQNSNLAISKNAGYASQNVNPNTPGVKIGSFVLQNQSSSESVRVTTLSLLTTYGAGTSSANLSGLRTSETSGNAGIPVQPATAAASASGTNTFSSDFTLAPGATKTIDILADSSSDALSNGTSTVISTLTVTSIGSTSNVSATSSATTGQTVTFRTGTLGTPTVTSSSSTPAQLIAAAVSGSTDGSVAVFNVVSANAASTITELTFTATTGTVTSIRVGSVTAPVVAGTAYMTGLNIAVPNGGSGVPITVYVSYAAVGSSGIASNTASTLTLTTIKSTSGNTTTTSPVSVAAPIMTLVGSKPVVAVTTQTSPVTGLNMGGENKIGEITVTADAKGDVKINDLQFAVSNVGFTTIPTFTLARIADGTTTVVGSSCGQGAGGAASQTIFCEFSTTANTRTTTTGIADVEVNTDFDGYTIAAGTSKVFSLYATVTAANTGTNLAQISTSLVAAGFNWDDTSTAQFVADASAASPSAGTNLTGSVVYNFPTNSYTIKQ